MYQLVKVLDYDNIDYNDINYNDIKQNITPTKDMFIQLFNENAKDLKTEGVSPRLLKDEYDLKYNDKNLMIKVCYSVVRCNGEYYVLLKGNECKRGSHAKVRMFCSINLEDAKFYMIGRLGNTMLRTIYRRNEGIKICGLSDSFRGTVTKDLESDLEYFERCERYRKQYTFFTKSHSRIIRYTAKYLPIIREGFTIEKAGECNLREEIELNPSMPKEQRIEIALNIITELQDFHKKAVHCDINPKNIMVTNNKKCKLVDFDFARKHSDEHAVPTGTPLFIAPELLETRSDTNPEVNKDATCTKESDVYSLGVTFLLLFSGESKFEFGFGEGCNKRSMAEDRLFKRDVRLFNIVYSMTKKNPNDRPTLGEVEKQLKKIQSCINMTTTMFPNGFTLQEYGEEKRQEDFKNAVKEELQGRQIKFEENVKKTIPGYYIR